MNLGEIFVGELKHEAAATRKMLERFPPDEADWQPHEKSMSLGKLASHVADVTNWIRPIVKDEELDFSKTEYKMPDANSADEIDGGI
jgi:uncharacterized damage-inducible protein DinB